MRPDPLVSSVRVWPGRDPWLLSMCLGRVLLYANFMVYAACLPVLRSTWAMSGAQAGSISGGFMVGYAISLVAFSWLAARFGARRLFLLSAALSALTALLFALFARSYASALWLYALAALSQGGTYAPALMLLADRYAPSTRGGALGAFIASASIGYACSLLLSGSLLARGGYELAFIVTGMLPLAGAAISWHALRLTANVVHPHGAGVFALTALRTNTTARRLILGYVGHCWELLGMWSWVSAFLAASLALSGMLATQAAAVGAYLAAALHLCGAIAASSMGSMSDRFGRRSVLLTLAALSTLLSLVVGWLVAWPLLLVSAITLLYGFTALGDSPVLSTALTETLEAAALGPALALRSLLGFAAGGVAPLVFGLVLDATNSPGTIPTHWGWAFATLGLGGLIASWCAYGLKSPHG
jgi:MFS family permease